MGTNCTVVFCHLTGAYISNITFSSSRMAGCPLSHIMSDNSDKLEKVGNKSNCYFWKCKHCPKHVTNSHLECDSQWEDTKGPKGCFSQQFGF